MDRNSQMPDLPRRMRRLRYHPAVRNLVRETKITPDNLVLPIFVRNGTGVRQPIVSMPGYFQLSPDTLQEEVKTAQRLGLGGVILFGIPDVKDAHGSDSYQDSGIVQQAIRAAKDVAPEMLVITDVCFCEYTDHGHCGVIDESFGPPDVNNDVTLDLLGRQALSHVRAGADMVAPSGMIDGMVGAIRRQLDAEDFVQIPIMSYAAKYYSAYYGPFREAAENAPQFGDRRSYQMDPAASSAQALREVAIDLEEGADLVLVKPALAYLDIIHQVHQQFPGVPLAAYNTSAEYSMFKAAAERGWVDEQAIVLETMTSIRRAGANILLTYWAKDVARWLGA